MPSPVELQLLPAQRHALGRSVGHLALRPRDRSARKLGRPALFAFVQDLLAERQPGPRHQGQRLAVGRGRVRRSSTSTSVSSAPPASRRALRASFSTATTSASASRPVSTLTPFVGTTIGIGYRSRIDHELEGTVTAPRRSRSHRRQVPITADLTTPDQVTVGISQAITPALTVHAGFEWTNWSVLETPLVIGPGGCVRHRSAAQLRRRLFLLPRLRLQLNDQLDRARRRRPTRSRRSTREIRSTRLPDNDRIWASLGATYQWNEKLSFDVAYTHIFAREDATSASFPATRTSEGLPFVGRRGFQRSTSSRRPCATAGTIRKVAIPALRSCASTDRSAHDPTEERPASRRPFSFGCRPETGALHDFVST